MKRDFVRYRNDPPKGKLEVYRNCPVESVKLSIIIPTLDKKRGGYLQKLINSIKEQTFKNWELILVIGDTRQGRAINCGASIAKGKYLLILDDDTQITQNFLFEKMVYYIEKQPDIGMAGVSNVIPSDAKSFIKKVMTQIPRRTSPIVNEIIDSDLAEHPCCIIPNKVFYEIGGENELIPRGLDPYLRNEIRKAGYRVVVLPGLYIHHLPPNNFSSFIKQFYRNGKMAAFVNKYYKDFVVDLAFKHNQKVIEKRGLIYRIFRYSYKIVISIMELKLYYLLSLITYLAGFIVGYLTLNKDDV
ncbi:MAG: glycosyltransferase [Candidatus Marinimicrobia bacterium]|nr:glycosyltransferase [Candidatus Neomarinimicrobiota bacterium]